MPAIEELYVITKIK